MRPRHLVTLLVLLALAVASAPTPAQAGGIVSVCDEANLLAALAGGGTVTFNCSGTITLTATITIAADTTIDGSGQSVTISGNHAVRVFTVNAGVTLNLDRLTVAGGSAATGGGIYNSGTLTVSNSTFAGNSAGFGGGGIDNSGTLTVSNSTFSSNSAYYDGTGRGGGIYNRNGGTLTVNNSTFAGNSAGFWGGGIENGGFGTVIVSNSTFSSNSATDYGGGIDNSDTVSVSNSTFAGNSAGYEGGGIANNGGTVTVSNSTFSGNSAPSGGGIDNTPHGTVTVKNTIVANSPAGGNCSGAITDGGRNLSYPDAACPGIHRDPLLGPLQNNGGPTQTMALGAGSGARDAADNAICAAPPVNNLDQRGIVRPQGPLCDIGAFEAMFVAIPPRAFLPMITR